MLTALETGVKGGKWFSLMDKVYALPTLYEAFETVKKNKGAAGVDHVTIEMFERQLDENLYGLHQALKEGTYRPLPVRRAWIDKPGNPAEKRPLGIPTIRDRVVQTALRFALEPIFERDFAECSHGFRPGRGCHSALWSLDRHLEAGYTWVVDADLKSYFDSIPQAPLMALVKSKVSDGRVLGLIDSFLRQGIMEGMAHWEPESGTPQGAVMSPLLSNIYLDPLDHLMTVRGYKMLRYADDFIIVCRSEQEARTALTLVQAWTQSAGLQLHPVKTRLVDATQRGGFEFLGYHFERGYKWPRQKSVRKLKDGLRPKLRRTNGHSLPQIILNVNTTLRGWFHYFKYGHRTSFPRLDKWVRMRLRSILRKRRRRRGRGKTLADHQRWPNRFFADLGLFFLTDAHDRFCQPLTR
jgi:RNA-directed DNA polymerase